MTLRRSMGLVALVALGLFAYEEFQDGSPPRFVVRSIPDRIARLRPGMTYKEADEILGLESSWLRGGLSARDAGGAGIGPNIFAAYSIGPIRPPVKGPIMAAASRTLMPSAIILSFTSGDSDWKRSKSTRLVGATFNVEGGVVARMRR